MNINWGATLKSWTVWLNLGFAVFAQALTDPSFLALIPPEWMPRILQAQAVVNLILRYKTSGAIRTTGGA